MNEIEDKVMFGKNSKMPFEFLSSNCETSFTLFNHEFQKERKFHGVNNPPLDYLCKTFKSFFLEQWVNVA